MLKKKQVVGIVSIALTCFLIGTSMASDGGSPWNKVWEAIYGLQSRVTAIEEETNHVKTIGFAVPMETVLEVPVGAGWTEWKNASEVFIWSPMNASNNAVLSIRWWFEYRLNTTIIINLHSIHVRLNTAFDDANSLSRRVLDAEMGLDVDYRHSGVIPFDWMGGIILPKTDCSQYKFWFQIQGHAHSLPFKAYVKNLNAIITVVDGLPESN